MHEKSKQSQWGGSSFFRFASIKDPKVRIIALVLALVFLVVLWLGLGSYAGSREARRMGESVPSVEVVGTQFSGVPALDMDVASRVADERPEERRRWPSEAMQYLLLEATNTPAVHAYRRNLLPIDAGSAAAIENDARPWRFKYVRFRGSLDYMREEDYEEAYGAADPPVGRVHRGRVRIAGSEPPVRVVFMTQSAPMWSDPNEPTARPELKLITDGWVRGRGIFVKRYLDSEGGVETPALLVVATKIERDYAPVEVKSLDDIPFGMIDDDPAIGAEEPGRAILGKEYPRALYRLVKYAAERAGDAGAARRKQEGLKPHTVASEAEWEEMIGQPARFRAKYLGGLGAIGLEPMRYGPSTITPNDAGVEGVLNGWILTDERKLIQFIAPVSLAGDWKQRTRIRWEGFFYKTKLYPANDGSERLAPVVVLTVLKEVPLPKPNFTAQLIIAGAFILGMGLLAFIVLREDKTKESYRRLRRKRVIAP